MKRHNEASLWYEQPARKWTEALPIGNGRLGAMVFGGITHERIQLNEDSVWSGGFRNRNNPDARSAITEIRTLLKSGSLKKAEELTRYALSGTPEFQRVYQTLGDLFLTFQDIPEPSYYKRELSLDDAVASTMFSTGGYEYTR